MVKKCFSAFLVFMACVLITPTGASAYVFNGYKVPNPGYVAIWVEPVDPKVLSNDVTLTKNHVTKWNACNEIYSWNNSIINSDILVSFEYEITSSAYAVARAYEGTISIYRKWADLSSLQKAETVVHEVGHTLGLSHCQQSKNAVSIMREFGFNGVNAPMSDDIAGIAALY